MNLKELKKLEKTYFDTYKSKRSNKDKASHLREMANVIDQIDGIENEKTKTK